MTDWTIIEFKTSKYLSFGKNNTASPPPQYEGAALGCFYRMRAYPSRRFHDRSVVYATAEYRYTPFWNPLGNTSWLRWLNMDWWPFVGFVEGGRVANEYSFSELLSDWKVDGGLGIRAFMAGGVVRWDMAVSDEGYSMWVLFVCPF